jgi:hypothetical protein
MAVKIINGMWDMAPAMPKGGCAAFVRAQNLSHSIASSARTGVDSGIYRNLL